jgi:hypothetical protein
LSTCLGGRRNGIGQSEQVTDCSDHRGDDERKGEHRTIPEESNSINEQAREIRP